MVLANTELEANPKIVLYWEIHFYSKQQGITISSEFFMSTVLFTTKIWIHDMWRPLQKPDLEIKLWILDSCGCRNK